VLLLHWAADACDGRLGLQKVLDNAKSVCCQGRGRSKYYGFRWGLGGGDRPECQADERLLTLENIEVRMDGIIERLEKVIMVLQEVCSEPRDHRRHLRRGKAQGHGLPR
jgi:hypothetical protein